MSDPAPLMYEVVAHTRTGKERIHRHASDEPLQPGQVLRLEGRYWLLESEANPDASYGWLCRLVDVSALAAAGFRRVRQHDLQLSD
jgi:hypothetical protein